MDFDKDNNQLILREGLNGDKFVEVKEINVEKVRKDLEYLKKEKGFDSIAVVLMHSYAYP